MKKPHDPDFRYSASARRFAFWGLIALVFALVGCDSTNVTDATAESEEEVTELKVDGPLRVAVLDDEPLSQILEREWRSISDYEIQVSNQTTADYLAKLREQSRLESDAVIFPSAMLGQLADRRLLRPLSRQNDESYREAEIYRSIRRGEMLWDRRSYAVSFGSPVLTLLYRKDLVPEAPQTWSDLGDRIEELNGTLPEGTVPLLQPTSDGWTARMLIVRAASYLYDKSKYSTVFNFSSMEPRIALPAFQRAATELAASMPPQVSVPPQASVPPQNTASQMTPRAVLEAFLDGKSAMAITWLSSSRRNEEVEAVNFPVAVADLPGSSEQYADHRPEPEPTDDGSVLHVTVYGTDGRLGAITRSAKNAELANIFLTWATAPEQSYRLSSRSKHTAPFRLSHASAAAAWSDTRLPAEVASDYAKLTKDALNRSTAMQFPRLPGQHEYIDALDQAVRSILLEQAPVDQAQVAGTLQSAAEKWNAITDRLGREQQKLAYRRSLGISTK